MLESAPFIRLSEAAAGVVLCATQRLARQLRAAHDEACRTAGARVWSPLAALSVDAWLGQVADAALLDGTLPVAEVPRRALTAPQVRLLWEQAIAADADAASLFDREGLAALAAEADELAQVWGLAVDGQVAEETASFLRWRERVRARCREGRWMGVAQLRAWRVGCIAGGAGRLPARVTFAGFDRHTPQENELARALAGRGAVVARLELGRDASAQGTAVGVADREAECRAAAAWVAGHLAENPAARLGIVVPQLAAVRATLTSALDDALHGEALLPAQAEMPRRYNVSLGVALADWPIIETALRLLRLAAQPRRIDQSELARLLNCPCWSAGGAALEARARLDARLRELLPPVVSLNDVLHVARRLAQRGLPLAETVAHLESLQSPVVRQGKERPSAWAALLPRLLDDAGWPGGRSLSSHEWQAAGALREVLAEFAAFDDLLGAVSFAETVRQLVRLCREHVFQPQTEGRPAVEVLGPLEAAGAEFDALWIMGMNDDAWPPPPRPNPLLPAAVQRRAGAPNASAEVQLAYAGAIHARLLASAPTVIFSWAQREGDKPLRPSPLLAGLAAGTVPPPLPTPIEARCGTAAIESVDDHLAPPLPEGSRLDGGVGILRAQAICPAWAYYQYRLGARALADPTEGLNAADRGTLLHRVMERFWNGRDSASLAALDVEARRLAAMEAVAGALSQFNGKREAPLSPRFSELERERLTRLLLAWIDVELARPAPFAVVACEQEIEAEIEGLCFDIRVDRIDMLEGGGRLILDYKTGRDLKPSAWAGERIVEPQLPAYATVSEEEVSGVAFAKVRDDGCGFVGLCAADDLLPGVKAAEDWAATLDAWSTAIRSVAAEIRAGEAAVSFVDEKQLDYCDVLPLLRLPEVRALREKT